MAAGFLLPPFSHGNASDTANMNFDGNRPYGGGAKGVYRSQTVDVGSLGYKNAFGLYDSTVMYGNGATIGMAPIMVTRQTPWGRHRARTACTVAAVGTSTR